MEIREIIEQTRQQAQLVNNKSMLVEDVPQEQLEQLIVNKYYSLMLAEGLEAISEKSLVRCKSMSKWFYSSNKQGLILQGTFGTGKSTLLKATSRAISQLTMWKSSSQRKQVVYTMANDIREQYEKGEFEKMKNCDLFLLDDLGVENAEVSHYGNKINLFYEIFFARYEGKKPTIIATNLTQEQIVKNYCKGVISQDRFRDRIFDMYDIKTMSGNSYRPENNQ